MLIEFPNNIGKSRDKCYSTDQKTSSIPVSTALTSVCHGTMSKNGYGLVIIEKSQRPPMVA